MSPLRRTGRHCETATAEPEMRAAGGFCGKVRFARFQNVPHPPPKTLRIRLVFADVKTGADLNLPLLAVVRQYPCTLAAARGGST